MNDYDGRVSTPRVLVGAALLVLGLAALIALAHWLIPPGGTDAPLPSAAPTESAEVGAPGPGAVTCPTPADLDAIVGPLRPAAGELIDCPDVYDGRTVRYVGEVIEAIFPLGDRAVVVVNDDPYALESGPLPEARTALGGNSGISVILPAGLADRLSHLGSYRERGDLVRVRGSYDSASDLLGGEPAIVAERGVIEEEGYVLSHRLDARTLLAAIVAASTAAAAAWGARRRRP